jgi:uncharacterized membrane protein
MNKELFISRLDGALRRLASNERNDILSDYEEHFSIGLSEGKTEEEISKSLGSPIQIAKEILADYHLEKVEATSSSSDFLRATWAVIGLGALNFFIVLGPLVGLIGMLVAGWTVGITFLFSPILIAVGSLLDAQVFEAFTIFISIALSGIGIFILIGMYWATKGLIHLFIKYLKFNVSIVKGGGNRNEN